MKQLASNQSEIGQVKTAIEVSDYLFNPNVKSLGQNANIVSNLMGGLNTNGGTWTNQTSRFQLGGASESNSSQKRLDKQVNGDMMRS